MYTTMIEKLRNKVVIKTLREIAENMGITYTGIVRSNPPYFPVIYKYLNQHVFPKVNDKYEKYLINFALCADVNEYERLLLEDLNDEMHIKNFKTVLTAFHKSKPYSYWSNDVVPYFHINSNDEKIIDTVKVIIFLRSDWKYEDISLYFKNKDNIYELLQILKYLIQYENNNISKCTSQLKLKSLTLSKNYKIHATFSIKREDE